MLSTRGHPCVARAVMESSIGYGRDRSGSHGPNDPPVARCLGQRAFSSNKSSCLSTTHNNSHQHHVESTMKSARALLFLASLALVAHAVVVAHPRQDKYNEAIDVLMPRVDGKCCVTDGQCRFYPGKTDCGMFTECGPTCS